MEKFDLIVIGSGPAGEKGAVKAAYFGFRVALVELEGQLLGGNQARICLKILSEVAKRVKKRENILEEYIHLKEKIINENHQDVQNNLKIHGVSLFQGRGEMVNANTVRIIGKNEESICADYILIATGSKSNHQFNLNYDQVCFFDEESIINISQLPNSVVVYGGTPTSFEIATVFAALNIKVTVIMPVDPLSFVDNEIKELFFKKLTVVSQEIQLIEKRNNRVYIRLEKGDEIQADIFVDGSKKKGNTTGFGIDKIKIGCDRDQFIEVNKDFQTNIPHIYAVGDVVGFPFSASNAMDQGRIAVSRMFNTADLEKVSLFSPHTIYSIPEISMVGDTEEVLKEKRIEYCVGRARYSEMMRGKLIDEKEGVLKLLFDPISLKILGIHILGKEGSEIIHYGMAILENRKTLSDILGDVFNYPSFHELYKYAAFDGLGNLTGHKIRK